MQLFEFVVDHQFSLFFILMVSPIIAFGSLSLFVSANLASGSWLFIWGCAGRRPAIWPAWLLAAAPMAAGGLAATCIGSLLLYTGFGGLQALGYGAVPLFPALTTSALVLSGHAACVGLGRGIGTRFRYATPKAAMIGAGVAAIALTGVIFLGGVCWVPCGLVALGIIGVGARDRDVLALGITATALHAASVALVSVWVLSSSSLDAELETYLFAAVVMLVGAIVPTLAVLGTLIVGAVESQSREAGTPASPAKPASTDFASSASGFPAPRSPKSPSTSSRYATKAVRPAA